jgi:hypothetical protein
MVVGHDTLSCTSKLIAATVDSSNLSAQPSLSGRRVVLVDTPGFDDTYHDDSEILKRIAEWLKLS